MKQLSLLPHSPLFHGGSLARGKRKGARPLSKRRPIHLTLKSRRAVLRQYEGLIFSLAHKFARKYGIILYDRAVNFDHLHFVLRIPGRREYVAFIRAFTSVLARKLGKDLWSLLPFTRVGSWGKDFRRMKSYCRKNREEAEGLRAYTPRTDHYSRFRRKPGDRQNRSQAAPLKLSPPS